MNKEQLQQQIEEMKVKLAEMESELNKPEVTINYWQPKYLENYYFVDRLNEIVQGFADYKKTYRVFKTREEAYKYSEYVKAEEILRRAIAKANEGWIPDFTKEEEKWYIVVDEGELKVWRAITSKITHSFLYIKDTYLAHKLLKEYEKEFKTYLRY